MRIDVNLATRPSVNRAPIVVLLAALVVGAGALTAWNVTRLLGTRSEVRAVEAQLGAIAQEETRLSQRREELRASLSRADLKELATRVAAADGVLSQKSVSWTLLLERLEELLPWEAELKDVHTNIVKGAVQMTVDLRVRSQDVYLQFVDALEASPCFADVYPASEDRDPQSGEVDVSLRFTHDPSCGALASSRPATKQPVAEGLPAEPAAAEGAPSE